jgi:hypothetical protein
MISVRERAVYEYVWVSSLTKCEAEVYRSTADYEKALITENEALIMEITENTNCCWTLSLRNVFENCKIMVKYIFTGKIFTRGWIFTQYLHYSIFITACIILSCVLTLNM